MTDVSIKLRFLVQASLFMLYFIQSTFQLQADYKNSFLHPILLVLSAVCGMGSPLQLKVIF